MAFYSELQQSPPGHLTYQAGSKHPSPPAMLQTLSTATDRTWNTTRPFKVHLRVPSKLATVPSPSRNHPEPWTIPLAGGGPLIKNSIYTFGVSRSCESACASTCLWPPPPHPHTHLFSASANSCTLEAETKLTYIHVHIYIHIIIIIKRRSGINPIPPTVIDRD